MNEYINIKVKLKKLIQIIYLKAILLLIFFIYNILNTYKSKKKIGVISLEHSENIGNNLLKYAIFIKLSELGFDPYIIGLRYKNHNISFIKNLVKIRIIKKSFDEIQQKDYDILMVNSDQTWRKRKFFYDIAFLRFAKNWQIPKFIYGASLGIDKWKFNKKDEKIAKYLLKNFTGISVREKGSIRLIEEHLGFKTSFVLDPTLLINKNYYLNLIYNYKNDVDINNNYIFIYTLTNSMTLNKFIKKITEIKNYRIYLINIKMKNSIEKFIYGIYKCKAVVTDSFHGTIFSLIFNKPFISFNYKKRGNERFNSLKEVFNLGNRIVAHDSTPDINLLEIPLNINKNLLNSLKKKSIFFLKKNLNHKKNKFLNYLY